MPNENRKNHDEDNENDVCRRLSTRLGRLGEKPGGSAAACVITDLSESVPNFLRCGYVSYHEPKLGFCRCYLSKSFDARLTLAVFRAFLFVSIPTQNSMGM
jgi:hypothetical protein